MNWENVKQVLISLNMSKIGRDHLPPPYDDARVDMMERKNGEPLPVGLRDYLTKVSSTFFFDMYPCGFWLSGPPTDEDIREREVDYPEWREDKVVTTLDYCEEIGDGGCAFDTVLACRGPNKGTVYGTGNGEWINVTADTFLDYLEKRIDAIRRLNLSPLGQDRVVRLATPAPRSYDLFDPEQTWEMGARSWMRAQRYT